MRAGLPPAAPRQRGFQLVEALVAVVVLSIGLFGVAGLQIQGVRYNYGSLSRSQAVILANDLAERIYANRAGANAGAYSDFDSTGVDCGTSPDPICAAEPGTDAANCSPTDMALYDQFVVSCGLPTDSEGSGRRGGVRDLLPDGRLQVDCVDNSAAAAPTACATGVRRRILLSWEERVEDAAGASELQNYEFPLVVQP